MIRVRFAPSPTGDLHVGNLRIAILNHLFAKKNKGRFVLRIDDTDIERNLPDGETRIFEQLKWTGIDWDEGPDRGGEFGPYRQSERIGIYESFFEELKRKKLVYPCFCDDKTIEEMKIVQRLRKEPPHYDGRCFNLLAEEVERLSHTRTPVWRFRILDRKEIVVRDFFRGEVAFRPVDLGGDFVVRRSNGSFMYNFTTVIDDATMQITHIIRGEDHLSNTAKQVAIYEALGLNPPQFIHVPLLLDHEGKKLSKREKSLTLSSLKKEGYTPEAIYFYLATLGWKKQPSRPLFPDELAEEFDLHSMGTSLLKWNENILAKWNEKFIKILDSEKLENYVEDTVSERTKKFLFSIPRKRRLELLDLIKENVGNLRDFEKFIRIFYDDLPYEEECRKFIEKPLPLQECAPGNNILEECLRVAEVRKIGKKKLFSFLRCILTGMMYGPPLQEIISFMEEDLIRKRWTRFWQEVRSGSKL